MNDERPPIPSFGRRATALTIAAFTGVAVVAASLLASDMIADPNRIGSHGAQLLFIFFLYLLIGSLIGVPLCLAIGLPLWQFAIRTGRQRQRDAHRIGLTAGAAIGSAIAIFLSVDIPANSAWYDAVLFFSGFCLAGICAGHVAHRLGYPRAITPV